jgi:SAM-dependent methyltransferase
LDAEPVPPTSPGAASEALVQLLNADRMVRYLDAVRAVQGVSQAKERTYALLELRPGDRVLDAECGTGEDVRRLAALVGPAGRAEGVDVNPWLIGEARRRTREAYGGPLVEFRVGDLYDLPYPDACFDAVRAERVFTHLIEPQVALLEMVRVVRPGGRVLVADPDFETLRLDGPDLPLTPLIFRCTIDRYPDGRIGGGLSALFAALSLEAIESEAMTHIARTLPEAETLLTLRRTAGRAQAQGHANAEAIAEWLEALEELDRAGRFACALTGYIVRGRKPRTV